MKQLFTVMFSVLLFLAGKAQPVLVNGGPSMAGVDGNTYTMTSPVGSGGYYGWVSASRDGSRFFTVRNDKLFFINSGNYAITDSMAVPIYEIASSNEYDILFGRGTGAIYRINTTIKTIVDSINITNPWRIKERPGTKELWLSADSMVHVISYGTGMSVTSFKTGSSQYDNGDIRFTKGGSTAFKVSSFNKKIYKIDAAGKTIVATGDGGGFIEVSSDSSKLFRSSGNTIYVHQTSDLSIIDSIKTVRPTFMMWRHPSKPEIWAVNHFDDTVTVFNESNYSSIDSIAVTGSPHVVAFATGATSVKTATKQQQFSLYPNPANDMLHLAIPDNKARAAIIYNCEGKVMMTAEVSAAKNVIDVSTLAAGIYYLSLTTEHGVEMQIPFVKQ